jgi:GNAT superfamily N-acetyltransferase
MRFASYPEAEVPVELRRQVVALQRQAWPSEGEPDLEPWHDPALRPRSLLLLDGDRVVAALDVLSKELAHAGERFAASGLSAVVTDEAVRGRGHGTTLVAEARRLLEAEADADLGIFTCDRGLQRFYERAGWEHLPGAVLVGGTPDDPFPSDGLGKVTLAAFFTERARAAAPTFVGARIALYPGRIDRLW